MKGGESSSPLSLLRSLEETKDEKKRERERSEHEETTREDLESGVFIGAAALAGARVRQSSLGLPTRYIHDCLSWVERSPVDVYR